MTINDNNNGTRTATWIILSVLTVVLFIWVLMILGLMD